MVAGEPGPPGWRVWWCGGTGVQGFCGAGTENTVTVCFESICLKFSSNV